MRFDCDRLNPFKWFDLYQDRRNRERDQWVKWFAWRPVKIENGECVWLEVVEKKYKPFLGDYTIGNMIYRDIQG